jgi:hypothetical protein
MLLLRLGGLPVLAMLQTLSPFAALSLVQSSSPLSNWPKMVGKSRLSWDASQCFNLLNHQMGTF